MTKGEERTARQLHELTGTVKSALASVVKVLHGKTEAEQAKAAEMISGWLKELTAIKLDEAKADAEAGVKTSRRTNPARESDRAPNAVA